MYSNYIRLIFLFFSSLYSNVYASVNLVPVFEPYANVNSKFKSDIEKKIKKKGLEPIFFSKYNDFKAYVESRKTEFYVSIFKFNKSDIEQKKIGRLYRKQYMVLSNKEIKEIKNKRVGIVQVADREKLESQIEKKFKLSFSLMKTVPKSEDLVPLIVFNIVDVILVDKEIVSFLKKRYSYKMFSKDYKFKHLDLFLYKVKK